MSKRAVLAVVVSTLPFNAVWAEEPGDWIKIAEHSKAVWQGKKASGHVTTVDGKKDSGYAYVYQVMDKQTRRYEYGQAVVLLEACRKGYGHVYYNDMEGKYTGRDPFVRFGPSVADNVGSTACTSWDTDTGKVSRQEADDVWELAATAAQSGDRYYLKKDTVRKRDYQGKPAVSALSRSYDVNEKKSIYSEYVTATADCNRGFGTVYQLDFDGALKKKYDVALNGDSVISAIAGALCGKL